MRTNDLIWVNSFSLLSLSVKQGFLLFLSAHTTFATSGWNLRKVGINIMPLDVSSRNSNVKLPMLEAHLRRISNKEFNKNFLAY
jgi:hypothetical protein